MKTRLEFRDQGRSDRSFITSSRPVPHAAGMEKHTDRNTEHSTSLRRRLGLVGAGLVFAVPVAGLATYGVAGATSAEDDPAEEVVEDCGEAWTPEDIAETNEEQDALAAFLDERGIAHTTEPDEVGIRWVVWDESDEAATDAVDQFYAERYPLTPEELADANSEEDALAAFLDERGIRYTRDTGADGVDYVVWDEHDDAATAAIGDFYAERYPTPPEQLAELQAREDDLAAFLDERGVRYTREADAEGIRWVVWDDNDEAANAAVEEFHESRDDSCVGMIELDAG
jgi:hypothetical protein